MKAKTMYIRIEVKTINSTDSAYSLELDTESELYKQVKKLGLPSVKYADKEYVMYFNTEKELYELHKVVKMMPKGSYYRKMVVNYINKAKELP